MTTAKPEMRSSKIVRHVPMPRECMLLFLLAVQDGEVRLGKFRRGKPLTLVRLPRSLLRRLWVRQRFSEHFLAEVGDWLLSVGWALVDTGPTFAAIKSEAVKNWPRLSAKSLANEIAQVKSGSFDFAELERGLSAQVGQGGEDKERDEESD